MLSQTSEAKILASGIHSLKQHSVYIYILIFHSVKKQKALLKFKNQIRKAFRI